VAVAYIDWKVFFLHKAQSHKTEHSTTTLSLQLQLAATLLEASDHSVSKHSKTRPIWQSWDSVRIFTWLVPLSPKEQDGRRALSPWVLWTATHHHFITRFSHSLVSMKCYFILHIKCFSKKIEIHLSKLIVFTVSTYTGWVWVISVWCLILASPQMSFQLDFKIFDVQITP
jgi:hypothetical protein